VTPLRINGSAIESLYSLLKFGAGGLLSALNYGSGVARVKARVEVSRVTDSGKSYRDSSCGHTSRKYNALLHYNMPCWGINY